MDHFVMLPLAQRRRCSAGIFLQAGKLLIQRARLGMRYPNLNAETRVNYIDDN
jgi:hypothetical protein